MSARRVRDGAVHGWGRPARWPVAAPWPFGPRHPNDGRQVTIFAAGRSFTLQPAELRGRVGRFRGHRHDGVVRPTATQLHELLVAAGVEPSTAAADAAALAAVSAIEGGFDALQTYDGARFSWGFVQFASSGGLPGLLRTIVAEQPAAFDRHFGAAGLGIDGNRLVVSTPGGSEVRGWRAINRLHDDQALWLPFLLAAFDPEIQRMQVVVAHRNYVLPTRAWTVPVAGRRALLSDVLAPDPLGHVAVVDHAVHRGRQYTLRLFARAAFDAGIGTGAIGSPEAARDVLAAARRLEPADDGRWRTLTTIASCTAISPTRIASSPKNCPTR